MRKRRHRAIAKAQRYSIGDMTNQEPIESSEMIVPLQTKKERQERAAKAIEDLRKVVASFGRRFGRKK